MWLYTSLILIVCTFSCATSSHDHQHQRHAAHHESRHQHAHQSRHHHALQHRAQSPNAGSGVCSWVCNGTGSSLGITIYFNESINIIAISTKEVALVIDLNTNLTALLDGKNATAIVIDINTETGVYLTGQSGVNLWNSNKETIQEYLNKIVSLKVLFNANNAELFTFKNISDVEIQFIVKIISKLITNEAITSKNALEVLTKYVKQLTKLFHNDTIKILFKYSISTTGSISINGDTSNFIINLEGILYFFSKFDGGISGLIKDGVQFDLVGLLSSENSIELLINLLLQTGTKINLAKVWGKILNDPKSFFELLVKLSGNRTTGIDGALGIFYKIILFVSGDISFEVFLDYLINVAINFNIESVTSFNPRILIQLFEGFNEVIKQQTARYGKDGLNGFATFISDILNNRFSISGFNLSAILDFLSTSSNGFRNPLQFVVKIISLLSGFIKFETSIPQIFYKLITSLNSSNGTAILQKLIPGLNVTGDADFLERILKRFNINEYLTGGLNIWKLFTGVPQIEFIINAFEAALKAAGNGSLNLEGLLTGDASFVKRIISFFQSILKIGGGVTLGDAWNITLGGGLGVSNIFDPLGIGQVFGLGGGNKSSTKTTTEAPSSSEK